MKFDYKLEIKNGVTIGYFPLIRNCYIQTNDTDNAKPLLKRAYSIYKSSYEARKENFYPDPETPAIQARLKNNTISTLQLSTLLRKFDYTIEEYHEDFVLFRNDNLPFNRILVPNTSVLSPMIVDKIFSDKRKIFS